jgi:hypothetical protein
MIAVSQNKAAKNKKETYPEVAVHQQVQVQGSKDWVAVVVQKLEVRKKHNKSKEKPQGRQGTDHRRNWIVATMLVMITG